MPRKPRSSKANAQAAAIARAAWEIPDDRYGVQFRARIPKKLAEEMASQRTAERGDVWADGVRVRRSLPKLMKLVNESAGLEYPSYIVDDSGVTVVWGPWSATASTTVEAVLMLLDEIFPDETSHHSSEILPD